MANTTEDVGRFFEKVTGNIKSILNRVNELETKESPFSAGDGLPKWARILTLTGLAGCWAGAKNATQLTDLSGNDNNLTPITLVGSVEVGTYIRVPYLKFGGGTFQANDTPKLDFSGNNSFFESSARGVTIGAWVKFNNDSPREEEAVIAKWNTTGNQRAYALYRNDDGQIVGQLSIDGSSSGMGVIGPEIFDTDWHFIVFRFNRTTQDLLLTVDGQTYSTPSLITSIHNSTAPFIIGNWGGGTAPLDGYVSLPFVCDAFVPTATITDIYKDLQRLYK